MPPSFACFGPPLFRGLRSPRTPITQGTVLCVDRKVAADGACAAPNPAAEVFNPCTPFRRTGRVRKTAVSACLYAVMGANAQKSAAYEKSLTPTSVKRNIVIAGFAFIPEIARIPGKNEYRITMFSGNLTQSAPRTCIIHIPYKPVGSGWAERIRLANRLITAKLFLPAFRGADGA